MDNQFLKSLYVNATLTEDGKPILKKPEDVEDVQPIYDFWANEQFHFGNTAISLEPKTVAGLIHENVDIFGLIESGEAVDASAPPPPPPPPPAEEKAPTAHAHQKQNGKKHNRK